MKSVCRRVLLFAAAALWVSCGTSLAGKNHVASENARGGAAPSTTARTEVASEDSAGAPAAAPRPPFKEDGLAFEPAHEAPPRHAPAPRPPRQSGPVKAGSADDNLQFGAFLKFADQHASRGLRCDVSDRVIVSVVDRKGLPLAGAKLTVMAGGEVLQRRLTYADGRAMIFRSESPALGRQGIQVRVSHGSAARTVTLDATGGHAVKVRLDKDRGTFSRVPLDVVFVFDTTGSMGDEIAMLKKTIADIKFQITNLSPSPDVRFGMVLYRDRGDDYRTRVIPLSGDVQRFSQQLGAVKAGGGGDSPEDVQEGLRQAMTAIKWRAGGVKVAFLIGDAAPHLDYGQTYTYVSAMRDAARRGIKIATVGASGLDRKGELVWRQVAQYTMSPFVFLTYGEKGDSEGSASSVSHHVGANWVAEKLDAIIVRMVKVELSHYSPTGAPMLRDYFTAKKVVGAGSTGVLEELFQKSIRQLEDYAVERITKNTPTVVLPLQSAHSSLAAHASKLESRLVLGLTRARPFKLVVKKDMPQLLRTINTQLALRYDSSKAIQIGKLVPAKLAVIGKLSKGTAGQLELLIKLVRLETGEVLSVSLLKIDRRLLGA